MGFLWQREGLKVETRNGKRPSRAPAAMPAALAPQVLVFPKEQSGELVPCLCRVPDRCRLLPNSARGRRGLPAPSLPARIPTVALSVVSA